MTTRDGSGLPADATPAELKALAEVVSEVNAEQAWSDPYGPRSTSPDQDPYGGWRVVR